jgi:molecular chaperone DnaK (HSP70)
MQKMFGMNPQLKELEHTKALGAAIYAALNTDSGSLTPLQRMSGGHDSGITFVSQHFLGVAYVDWLTNQWLNHTVIHKDEKLPVSRTYRVKTNTLGHLQPFKLTQSAAEETNPDFTKILWGGAHTMFAPLSEIDLTFGYDANGTANASMTEVATGQRTQIDLHSSQNE